MNYSLAIFLISDQVRAVNVVYEKYKTEEEEKRHGYYFKTLDHTIKPGDYVIIQTDTRHNMTVCKVVEVDVEPDFDSHSEFKWIIGKVDRADFDDLERQENEAIVKIKSAEKRKKRKELSEALMEDAGADLAALPIYTPKQEEKEALDDIGAEDIGPGKAPPDSPEDEVPF